MVVVGAPMTGRTRPILPRDVEAALRTQPTDDHRLTTVFVREPRQDHPTAPGDDDADADATAQNA